MRLHTINTLVEDYARSIEVEKKTKKRKLTEREVALKEALTESRQAVDRNKHRGGQKIADYRRSFEELLESYYPGKPWYRITKVNMDAEFANGATPDEVVNKIVEGLYRESRASKAKAAIKMLKRGASEVQEEELDESRASKARAALDSLKKGRVEEGFSMTAGQALTKVKDEIAAARTVREIVDIVIKAIPAERKNDDAVKNLIKTLPKDRTTARAQQHIWNFIVASTDRVIDSKKKREGYPDDDEYIVDDDEYIADDDEYIADDDEYIADDDDELWDDEIWDDELEEGARADKARAALKRLGVN